LEPTGKLGLSYETWEFTGQKLRFKERVVGLLDFINQNSRDFWHSEKEGINQQKREANPTYSNWQKGSNQQ
jgi:hypothetical protein